MLQYKRPHLRILHIYIRHGSPRGVPTLPIDPLACMLACLGPLQTNPCLIGPPFFTEALMLRVISGPVQPATRANLSGRALREPSDAVGLGEACSATLPAGSARGTAHTEHGRQSTWNQVAIRLRIHPLFGSPGIILGTEITPSSLLIVTPAVQIERGVQKFRPVGSISQQAEQRLSDRVMFLQRDTTVVTADHPVGRDNKSSASSTALAAAAVGAPRSRRSHRWAPCRCNPGRRLRAASCC